ncbi:hypothetical protein FB451DRAFT_1183877 [Mycena latifolia]|nr:hypothetical protein FB451DRAFT_1183877 [Mycena latifolia]
MWRADSLPFLPYGVFLALLLNSALYLRSSLLRLGVLNVQRSASRTRTPASANPHADPHNRLGDGDVRRNLRAQLFRCIPILPVPLRLKVSPKNSLKTSRTAGGLRICPRRIPPARPDTIVVVHMPAPYAPFGKLFGAMIFVEGARGKKRLCGLCSALYYTQINFSEAGEIFRC